MLPGSISNKLGPNNYGGRIVKARPTCNWKVPNPHHPHLSKSSLTQEATGRLTREPTPTQEVWDNTSPQIGEPGRAIEDRLGHPKRNNSGNRTNHRMKNGGVCTIRLVWPFEARISKGALSRPLGSCISVRPFSHPSYRRGGLMDHSAAGLQENV